MVEANRTDVENSFRRLAHLYDTTPIWFRCDKMQVSHFRDGMPDCIVVSPLSNFTTMQMHDRNPHDQSGLGNRQSLEAVTKHYQHIRP